MITAMIVEDSDNISFPMTILLRKYLTDNDVEVVGEAQDGNEAVRIYKEKKPDLIFMDIVLKGIDGLKAAKDIKEFDSEANIVICTSYSDEDHIHNAISIGIFDYILKPFSGNRIKELVLHYRFITQKGGDSVKLNNEKVLVVDDSMIARVLMKKSLMACNIKTVIEASNGRDAIEKCKVEHPEIIIIDIIMPIMDGISAIREILKIAPNTKIVICSSMNNIDSVKEAFKAGAKEYITKPFKTIDIRNMLNYINDL